MSMETVPYIIQQKSGPTTLQEHYYKMEQILGSRMIGGKFLFLKSAVLA